jgi:hypothetical protein
MSHQYLWKTPGFKNGGTLYPPACKFVRLKHQLYSPLEIDCIEGTMQCTNAKTGALMITYFAN